MRASTSKVLAPANSAEISVRPRLALKLGKKVVVVDIWASSANLRF